MGTVVPHPAACCRVDTLTPRQSWPSCLPRLPTRPSGRLITRTRERWADLADPTIRHRGQFVYVDGGLRDETTLPLLRLRYGGSANSWGFAIHLASRDSYEDATLPSGYPFGTPEEALDCACGLYLNDPTAWTKPPTN